jgi:hypothetical protein
VLIGYLSFSGLLVTQRICDGGQEVSQSSCQRGRNCSPSYFKILGMHSTCNVTVRRVCATAVVVERHYVLHISRECVGRLMYTPRNTHAPYFSKSFHKKNDFLLKKELWNINRVF